MGKRRSFTELEAIRISDKETRTRIPGVAVLVYLTLIVLAALALYNLVKYNAPDLWVWVTAVSSALISTYVLFALKVADQWEKAVMLRFGRFTGLRGPGIFWIVPVVD
ncbi:MAG: SPFH domain-containing protein, partial [Anaerolineales bacterium]|nr:SPFH domain-containing protein [Anaerolineales bacterium]